MMDQHEELQIELAHRERRRADRLLKALRFEEAIVAHEEATLHLEKARALSNDPTVQESLQLQIAFHNRQKQVVCYKQELQRNQQTRHTSILYIRNTADTIELAEMALPDCADSVGTSTRFKPQDFRESFTKQLHSITDRNDELLLQIYKTISKSNESINGSTSNLLENGQLQAVQAKSITCHKYVFKRLVADNVYLYQLSGTSSKLRIIHPHNMI